jgi:hypothetical protein
LIQKVFPISFGVLTACLALTAAGCGGGGDGPKLYSVSGKVTLDGEPVKEGRILFRMTGGNGRSYSAPITDGSYELKSEAGSAAVEITASRIIPGKIDKSNGTPEPVGEMYIPKKYNSETTLKADVKESSNTIPFELTSKKK